MKIYGYVEKGIGKAECQDRVLIGDTILAGGFLEVERKELTNVLVAVADGVGGYAGGEKASLLAVDSIRVLNRRSNLVVEDIRNLMEYTNMQIKKTAQMSRNLEDMATTLTALVMNEQKAVTIHIGNCRLGSYQNYLTTLTKDQTTVAEMITRGEISEEEAMVSPLRNRIEACLGSRQDYFHKLKVEEVPELLEKDSTLVMTCDGVHDYISIDELESLLDTDEDAKTVCKKIAKKARECGSEDDISIILVDRAGNYEGNVGMGDNT